MASDVITAIGTLALAGVTVVLVYATFRLAKQGNRGVHAQWLPVVLLRQWQHTPEGASDWAVTWDGMEMSLLVENVGRGPALGVRGRLQNDDETFPTALAPGDTTWLTWEVGEGSVFPGRLVYSDLAGAVHETQFEVEFFQRRNGRINHQRVKSDVLHG